MWEKLASMKQGGRRLRQKSDIKIDNSIIKHPKRSNEAFKKKN